MVKAHYALIENGKVKNVVVATEEIAKDRGYIPAFEAGIGDTWDGEKFIKPTQKVPEPPDTIEALQGLMALDEAGLSKAFETWANAPERTFIEKAFINRASTWKRNDLVLLSGAGALGLTSQDLDTLFKLASSK